MGPSDFIIGQEYKLTFNSRSFMRNEGKTKTGKIIYIGKTGISIHGSQELNSISYKFISKATLTKPILNLYL